MIVLLMIRFI